MTGAAATWALARLALVRASRGKALYIAMGMIALPVIITSVRVSLGHDRAEVWKYVFGMNLLLLPIVPSILIGPSLADEIEDKTSAYLWSRPLPRWSIVAGKLVGLAPIAALILAGALAISWGVAGGPSAIPTGTALRCMGAAAAAGVVGSMLVAAVATLVPRHAVATAVVYLLFVDTPVGFLQLKFKYISVSFAARAAGGFAETAGAVAGVATFCAIGALTLFVAIRRIATLE